MARGKKKEALTLEKKLEAALVPEEEQPYPVPENWCWTYLSRIAIWGSGGTPSRKNPGYYNGSIPWIKTGELEDRYIFNSEEKITDEALRHSSAKIFPVDSVLIAMYGATIGKTAILGIPATTNQACACAQCKDGIYNKYLFYYLRSQKSRLIEQGQGGAQPNISQDIIKKQHFPLPPLPEQHRIVSRIESLFSQLDEAREKAQEALEGFESRRAALLHQLFTGEMTEQWRKKHGRKKIHELKTIADICLSLKYGTAKKSEVSGKVAVIRMGNLQGGEIDWTNLVYSNDEDDNKKYTLLPGDVLFNRTNSPEWVGKTSIYRGEYPAIYAGYIIKLDYDREIVDGDYLNYILNSSEAKEYCNKVKTDGVNQSNINAKKIGAFSFSLPPLEEQRAAVNILRQIFASDKLAWEIAGRTIDEIDTLKKSILAKAFRGELGTNDPEDECAIELLKGILDDTRES